MYTFYFKKLKYSTGLVIKNPPGNVGDAGLIPGLARPLEKGMATHSCILAWEFHGQSSLVGPRGWKESDTSNWVTNTPTAWFIHKVVLVSDVQQNDLFIYMLYILSKLSSFIDSYKALTVVPLAYTFWCIWASAKYSRYHQGTNRIYHLQKCPYVCVCEG